MVRQGFSEVPPEVLEGQVPCSKLASKDAALFALPKGRRDALGIGNDHCTRLPEPGESSESGSNFPAWRREGRRGGRRGAGPQGAGPGRPSQWGGAARRGGEAGRRRGDAGARPGAEAELADPERIRRRAPRPRHSPGAGFLAARTVRGAPPRSRLCGVSGSWEPPRPRPRPLRRGCRWRPRPRRAGPVPVGCGRAEGPGGRRRAAAPLSLHRLPQPGPGPTLRRTGRRAGNAGGPGAPGRTCARPRSSDPSGPVGLGLGVRFVTPLPFSSLSEAQEETSERLPGRARSGD